MPGSRVQCKEEIKNWVNGREDIYSILDIGCGAGTYRKLLGDDYFWIGVDIWAEYIKRFNLDKLYHTVVVADAFYLDFDMFHPIDLCILGDVIEHMPKEKGLALINKALHYCRHVIISIPLTKDVSEVPPGDEHYGNWFEKHVAGWTQKELQDITKWDKVVIANKNYIGAFIT